jgi:hypothetical protein
MNSINALESTALSRVLKPMASHLKPDLLEALAALSAPDEDQERYQMLASKNTEGTLSESEKTELEACVSANRILSLLKTEAIVALARLKAA